MLLRILPIVILLVANSAFTFIPDSCEASEGDFYGLIEREIKNDTLYIDYLLTPYDFEPDSVVLEVPENWDDDVVRFDVTGFDDSINRLTIYRASESIPFENNWRSVRKCGDKICLEGNIKIPLDGQEIFGWVISATGYITDSTNRVLAVYSDEYLHPWYAGVAMEWVLPSYGYFQSQYPKLSPKKGPFLGWGLAFNIGNQRNDFSISTSWSGLGKNFTFSEPFRVGYRYYTGTRQNFMPSVYGAFKLSKIKLKDGEDELLKRKWGFEGGLAFESSFERIGYHYSTAFGGYHTVELLLSYGSGFTSKGGTRYQIQRSSDLWMVRVSFHIEGWNQLAGARAFRIENKRPLPHKILALAGFLPMAPLAGIGWIIQKVSRRDY